MLSVPERCCGGGCAGSREWRGRCRGSRACGAVGGHCPCPRGSPEVLCPQAMRPGPAFATGAGAGELGGHSHPCPYPRTKPGTVPVGLTPPSPASPAAPGAIQPPLSPGCPGRGVHPAACGGGGRDSAGGGGTQPGAAGRGVSPPPARSGLQRGGVSRVNVSRGGGWLARSCGWSWPRNPPHHKGSAPALGLRL